jgi:DNA-binding response OmpR family regulator
MTRSGVSMMERIQLFMPLRANQKSYVLDIMLPGRDGLSVLRALRDRSNAVPVLILTARGEICEKVERLDLGADDYLAEPFSIEKVATRLRASMRRQTRVTLVRYRIGTLPLTLRRESACRGNRRINLTGREFSLLERMMRSLDGPVRDTFLSRC